jgi:hypothetical protein
MVFYVFLRFSMVLYGFSMFDKVFRWFLFVFICSFLFFFYVLYSFYMFLFVFHMFSWWVRGGGGLERMDYRLKLFAVFSRPEVAAVGLTEREAGVLGLEVDVARYPFNDHGRSMVQGEEDGFVKLVLGKLWMAQGWGPKNRFPPKSLPNPQQTC